MDKNKATRRGSAFFGVLFYLVLAIGIVSLYQQFIFFPLDHYEENKVYDLTIMKAPVLTGFLLRAFAWVVTKSPLSVPIIGFIHKDSQFPEVTKFAAHLQREQDSHGGNLVPTFFPSIPPSPEMILYAKTSRDNFSLEKFFNENKANQKDFAFWTIKDYAESYRNKSITPTDVAQKILKFIKDSDAKQPSLRAFVEINDHIFLEEARASTERFKKGTPISFFDGIPIAVKDEMNVKGYHTKSGTTFLGERVEEVDATIVERLRNLGAIFIGKTAMVEIGLGVTGHNPHNGVIRTAYNTSHYSGGSSSGSGASVSAGFTPLALGADGGGSIRIPSANNGIVGLKATFGRIPETGASPLCWTVGHLGPMGATAFDVALAYFVIAGKDSHDTHSFIQPEVHISDFNKINDLSDLRIGVFKEWNNDAAAEVVKTTNQVIELLKSKGAQIVDIQIPHLQAQAKSHTVSIVSEMITSMKRFYVHGSDRFGLDVQINLAAGMPITASEYVAAQQIRTWAIQETLNIYKKVDVIITPATGVLAPRVLPESLSDGISNITLISDIMRFAFWSNFVGNPALVVPAAYSQENLPISVHFMGRFWEEHTLLRLANFVEHHTAKKKPERFYSVLG